MEMDRSFDEVDPRVQIELERLNTATDDINKLEVDLDESRAGFRQLLCESTVRIDALAKKLGTCIERSRPYYDARMKAKDALQETQHAAVRFERANSAHSAAREMVFLAEEGLCAEGRTFDHAWQEMLNHATMRVNESEVERTLSETEHRRTSQSYHRAETRVQQLQKELKRAIAKSSLNARRSMMQISSLAYRHQLQLLPYFEMKAQFNQVLEDQKRRVKSLETQVGQAKTTYAQALRNLEQISDEIHRTRKYENGLDPLGARGAGVGADSPLPNPDSAEPRLTKTTPPGASSNSDMWSLSTGTGHPDSESGEEFLKLPDKLGPTASPTANKSYSESSLQVSEYLGLQSLSNSVKKGSVHQENANRPMAELPIHSQNTFQSASMSPRHSASKPAHRPLGTSFAEQRNVARRLDFDRHERNDVDERIPPSHSMKRDDSQTWTEISLVESPEETRPFAKMGQNAPKIDRDYIHYSSLEHSSKPETSTFSSLLRNPLSFTLPKTDYNSDNSAPMSPAKKVANWIPSLTSKSPEEDSLLDDLAADERVSSRGKLDSTLAGWISRSTNSDPSEQGSPSTNRRQSLDVLFGGPTTERVKELLSHGMMMLNISALTERRGSETRGAADEGEEGVGGVRDQDSVNDEMRFIARESRMTKKVPSPLEKTLYYLNAEDDSQSDSESLASVEMLTDDQISSLMLEQDLQDACEQVLGTPVSEISPLIQELRKLEQTRSAQDSQ